MKKIILGQLPLITPGRLTTNIPYAAACLKSTSPKELSVCIVPSEIMDIASDSVLAEFILKQDVDAAGFTCFLWNVERTLHLCKILKEKNKGLFLILGGPEITKDCRWLDERGVDLFVVGESEEIWPQIISQFRKKEKSDRLLEGTPTLTLTSPYLTGDLEIPEGGSVYVESLRGCPRRCSYCFYSRTDHSVRFFNPDWEKLFELFAEKKALDVYIMDPSFDAYGKDLPRVLEQIALANKTRLPLHTELALEKIDSNIATLMKKAGFVSVEAGLQSTNPKALKSVKRPFLRDKFLEGARNLRIQGIRITVGLILGLPHDSVDDFAQTLEFVCEAALEVDAEVYPLSVLPGTQIRKDAADLRIEYSSLPPYWITKTDNIDEEGFLGAEDIVEDILGKRLFQDIHPFFQDETKNHVIDARGLKKIPEQFGMMFNTTVLLTPEDIPLWISSVSRHEKKQNPFSVYQFVVECTQQIDEDLLISLSDAFFDPSGFAERMHGWDLDLQGRFGTRIFWLTNNLRNAIDAQEVFADVIFDARGLKIIAQSLVDNLIPVLADGHNFKMLSLGYADDKDLVLGPWN